MTLFTVLDDVLAKTKRLTLLYHGQEGGLSGTTVEVQKPQAFSFPTQLTITERFGATSKVALRPSSSTSRLK